MADVKYFADLTNLAPASPADDGKIMAIQSDPSGVGGYKTTLLNLAAYVNASVSASFVRVDGTTPLTADWDAGAFKITADTLESDLSKLTPGTAPGAPADGDNYYDTASNRFRFRENGAWVNLGDTSIWDRTGTTISVENAGDDIDFSTAGLLQSAQFDSSNIAYYDSHPTFTGTTDIVDKKYVDDKLGLTGQKDVLTVSTPGQTVFTLTTTPTNLQTMGVHVNGAFYDYTFGFTVSGTTLTWLNPGGLTLQVTDRVIARYDFDIAASPFTQYWQKVGSTLSPVTGTDDVNVKDLEIGKTTSGTINGKTDIDVALLANGTGSASLVTAGTGDADITSTSGAVKINSVNSIEVTGDFDSTKILQYDSHPTFAADTDIIDKKYVDDHTTNGIWQRVGTTISVKNGGDDIDLSTAGLVQTGTFDSANISAYNTHPTFSADTQIVDKKYVDDTSGAVVAKLDPLPITSPGQTAFTLSQTPSGADSFQLFLNGLKQPGTSYSFVGTALTWGGTPVLDPSQFLEAQYDWQAPSIGILNQKQIYYVGDSGSDSNDGKSIEHPFLTLGVAVVAVNAQSPTNANRFEIQIIGAPRYLAQTITVPRHTILNGRNALFEGTFTVPSDSGFLFNYLLIPGSTTGIIASGFMNDGKRIIKGDKVLALSNNAIFIEAASSAEVHVDVPDINMGISGCKAYDIATSAKLYMNYQSLQEGAASTNDGTGLVYASQVGNPAFRGEISVTQTGTGAGSTITLLCDSEDYDIEGTYNIANGRYTCNYKGIYHFTCTLATTLITAANNDAKFEFVRRNSGGSIVLSRPYYVGNPGVVRGTGIQSFTHTGSIELRANAGDTIEVQITISGGASDNIQFVPLNTSFSGHMVTPLV